MLKGPASNIHFIPHGNVKNYPKTIILWIPRFTVSMCDAVSKPNLMTVAREDVPLNQGIRTIKKFECGKCCC